MCDNAIQKTIPIGRPVKMAEACNVSRIDSLEFHARLLNLQRAEFSKHNSFQNFCSKKQSICRVITQRSVALAHLRLTILTMNSIDLIKIKTNMKKLLYKNGGVWLGLVMAILGSTSNSQESSTADLPTQSRRTAR